uniref:Reverse transcriptase domain-containing protein n=1 Tax=Tanacetum cinerariifolium TaxID=118510 RepID=A0A6L2JVJ5_TANCI|nr:reverse transcriptase domain-containing protein [Tanacetum cinerariifolium]
MTAEGNSDPPVPDLRTMEELCQPSLNGRGGPISPIAIQATNFGLKNDMIQQVQNSCQFHGLPAWFDRLLRNSINTIEQMVKMFLGKYFPPSMVTKLRNEITNFHQCPDESLCEAWKRYKLSIDRCGTFMKRHPEECYDLIENMIAQHNDWDTSAQRSESSSSITSSNTKIAALKAEMAEINKNFMRVLQVNQQVKAVTPNCETCGGPHSYNDCPATVGQTHNVYVAGAYQAGNSYQPQGNRNLLSYCSDNYLGPPGFNQNQNQNNQNQNFQNQNRNQGNHHPHGNNQGRNQFFQEASHGQNPPPAYQAPAYQAPGYQAPVHQPPIPQPQVVTTNEFTNYMKANDFMKMNTASSSGSGILSSNTITNPKEDLKGITTCSGTAYQGPTIPTTSFSLPKVVDRETEVTKDTVHPTNNESTKDVQPLVVQAEFPIQISEPVVAPIIEPVVAPVSAPKPNQNLQFHALILMPKFSPTIKTLLTNKDKLSELARTLLNEHCSGVLLKKFPEKLGDPAIWNKLSLPELSPTCMNLELADRLISRPVGVIEDVFVKVGTFHFPVDFIVVDFDADPRVPLILGRSFLKTRRALIDVFEGELTLRVGKEAITFNLDQTSRYSANYNDMTANRIDDSDFLLEEVNTFLALEDNPTSPEVDHSYFDPERGILLLEAFHNDDLSLPPLNQGNYLHQVRKELKICDAKSDKSSIDEPLEVELKDLPPHLEYVFLEGDDKLPFIIAKDLSDEEKTALLTVLKSHKRAIAWKLSDIKGINPEFCAHKIIMEEDFKPAVQHQRMVNLKIHDVIKKEVEKLLDAGLVYPISDSPWVSPIHCVPKKGGFTVVKNEENELIPTRLVTGWRVCIDYRKLNEATCKDHFHLPFMDQMLERLEENEYYCFLDGFSSYFQIPIDLKDQENTTFTCPYRTFAYRHMPFGLCNAPGTFQRCGPGQHQEKHFRPIHYASKKMTEAESNYTTTEKEMLAVVYAFEKFRSYLILNKSIVYTDHSAHKYLFSKKDSKAILLRWVLLLQEFKFKVIDTKGVENLSAVICPD